MRIEDVRVPSTGWVTGGDPSTWYEVPTTRPITPDEILELASQQVDMLALLIRRLSADEQG